MKNVWWARVDSHDVMRMVLRRATRPQGVTISKSRLRLDMPPSSCILVWNSDPAAGGPPSAIIVHDSEITTLLTRLLAVPGGLSSITNFSRVWPLSNAVRFFERRPRPLSDFMLSGLIGLILGELLFRLGDQTDIRRIGMAAVSRTYSYSCTSLTLTGGYLAEVNALHDAWFLASKLTANEADASMLTSIRDLFIFLNEMSLDSDFDGNSASLAKIIDRCGSNAVRGSQDLFLPPLSARLERIKNATREERFALVEQGVVEIKSAAPDGGLHVDLACGFLISQLDIGTLDFVDFARGVGEGRAGIACAYLMCSGLLSSQLLWKGEGLGMNILANLQNELTGRLHAKPDLSLAELSIFRDRIAEDGFQFRTKHLAEVEVELVSDVTGVFANGVRRGATYNKPGLSDIYRDEIYKLHSAADRAADLIDRLQKEISGISAFTLDEMKSSKNRRRY